MRRACIAAVAALSGCMVGPDYTRPAVDAPKAFIYEVSTAADTANTLTTMAPMRQAKPNRLQPAIPCRNMRNPPALSIFTRPDAPPHQASSAPFSVTARTDLRWCDPAR